MWLNDIAAALHKRPLVWFLALQKNSKEFSFLLNKSQRGLVKKTKGHVILRPLNSFLLLLGQQQWREGAGPPALFPQPWCICDSLCSDWPTPLQAGYMCVYPGCFNEGIDLILCDCHLIALQDEGWVDGVEFWDRGHDMGRCWAWC